MNMQRLEIPVAFIVFNRIEPVMKVFDVIRKVKPTKLYIISDAARPHIKDELQKVSKVRAYIEANIDWDCELHKNYAEKNMGCRDRIVSGINWCFETETKLIILEDDCLPDTSFFGYAKQLLDQYENDPRIMHIGGYNMLDEYITGKSYLFSQRPCAWGWATWKRAWEKYDVNMKGWPEVRDSGILRWRFSNQYAYEDRVKDWDDIYYKRIDAWGYAWDYALIINNAYAIYPPKNLIQNIGFGEDATHTLSKKKEILGNLHSIELPLDIRKDYLVDRQYDEADMEYTRIEILKRRIRKIIPKIVLSFYHKLKR